MIFKLRTAKKTMKIFEEIAASTNYAPFILAKLSISLSLRSDIPLVETDFKTDIQGLELNRQTITAQWDLLYKCLIEMSENRHLDDDEFFQKYIKAHLDRGAKILYSEFKYNGDLLLALLKEEKSI